MKNLKINKYCLECIIIFALVLGFSVAWADSGRAGVGKEILALPYKITSPGFYYIKKDLSCPKGSSGITILTNDVTLDLMGFSLIGPGGSGDYDGIYMHTRKNVEIRNGTIKGFPRCAIYERGADGRGHRIFNIRASDNFNGIYLNGINHIIERCTVVGKGGNPGNGIFAGKFSTVTGNICHENKFGIKASSGSTVIGNTCSSNSNTGIYLIGHCVVDQNTAFSNDVANRNECSSCEFGTNHF